jgi:hypothetical protein
MLYKDMGRRLPFLHLFTVFILTRQVMDSLMNHYKLIAEKTRKYVPGPSIAIWGVLTNTHNPLDDSPLRPTGRIFLLTASTPRNSMSNSSSGMEMLFCTAYQHNCVQVLLTVVRIAGSETTATSLGTLTYYLCKNPEKLAKLKEEVRTSFKSNDEINGISTAKLPYLVACIKEGLRIFPPSTYGLPRISHGVVIDGHYVPNGVNT